MYTKVLAFGMVASAAAAGPSAGNTMRLRGGFAGGFAKLNDTPSEHLFCPPVMLATPNQPELISSVCRN